MTSPFPFESVRALYDRGLFLQALECGERELPLADWPGIEGRLLAARLVGRLGDDRLAATWVVRAHRAEPEHPGGAYFFASYLLGRHGPAAAWRALREDAWQERFPETVRADTWALSARVHAILRDFATAREHQERAQALEGDRHWIRLERARLHQACDEYERALEGVRALLAERRGYAPAVVQAAHLLELLERDEEAIALLQDALACTENAVAAAKLAMLLREHERFDELWLALDRFEQLSPRADRDGRLWLDSLRSETAYRRGDDALAARFAERLPAPLNERIARGLRTKEGRRVQLSVGFVRQHHQTCVPATLALLARFLGEPVDHLQVSEAICYGGTTEVEQRRWVRDEGFCVREFTVTRESAQRLLDHGLPFALSTIEAASGHSQAVVGYDERRQSVLVRDPYDRALSEWSMEELLERYRASGPRGLVFVPAGRREELERLPLPDAGLYDRLFALGEALATHDRDRAYALGAELEELAPGHRLSFHARFQLASYDRDEVARLAAIEALLALDPEDERSLFHKLTILRETGRRDERLALLERLAASPKASPVFLFELAQELAQDSREGPRVRRLLRTVLRAHPTHAGGYSLAARLDWEANRGDPLALARFAACLHETDESLAWSYFALACSVGREEEALAFLDGRWREQGDRSGLPARSLFGARVRIGRMDAAFAGLEEALERRPDDDALLTFAADAYARHARHPRAQELLERARPRTKRAEWERCAAACAQVRGEPERALQHLQESLALEPLDVDARRQEAELLSALEGPERTLLHVLEVAERWSFHAALQRLCIGWVGVHRPDEAERLLRRQLDRNPSDAWSQRELGWRLLDQGRVEEALGVADEACHLEPANGYGHYLRGVLLARLGRSEEAVQALREAVSRTLEIPAAIWQLVETSVERGTGPAALDFVLGELVAQALLGLGPQVWRRVAQGRRTPERLLADLEDLRESRPEAWQTHAALASEYLARDRLEEALAVIEAAVRRFPLVLALWHELGVLHRALGNRAEEERAWEGGLAVDPRWSAGLRQRALMYEREGELERSKELLEEAVAADPLEAMNHFWLADTLLELGACEEALDRAERASQFDPEIDGLWPLFRRCAERAGKPGRPFELLRRRTEERPGDARAWLLLARNLDPAEAGRERLQALEEATRLAPRSGEALDLLVEHLTLNGRSEEALERLHAYPDSLPLNLRGREAWVYAERGEGPRAVEGYRAALEEDPAYDWARMRLAECLEQLERLEDYRTEARTLVERSPREAIAHGYLGHAEERLGRRTEAREAYQRALSLEPDYTFAGCRLIDLALGEKALDQARAVLAGLEEYLPEDERHLYRLRVAATGREEEESRAEWRALLDAGTEPEVLENAWEVLEWAQLAELGREELDAKVRAPDARPAVGRLWMRSRLKAGWRASWKELSSLDLEEAAPRAAAREFVDAAIEAGAFRQLKRLRQLPAARVDDELWAHIGRALLVERDFDAAIAWLSDWEQREGVRAWTLSNLAVALRNRRRMAEAAAVSERALELEPDSAWHALWLASDALARGDRDRARELCARGAGADLSPYYRCLRELIETVIALDAERDAPEEAYRRARHRLGTATRAMPNYRSFPALRAVHRECVSQIARFRGGVVAGAWRLLHLVH